MAYNTVFTVCPAQYARFELVIIDGIFDIDIQVPI
jgi:hypothetical protein